MPTPRRKIIATARRACCTDEIDVCVCAPQVLLSQLARPYAFVVVSLLHKHGKLRFGELEARVQGASAKALTARLRKLEQLGILGRTRLSGAPPAVEYKLTPYGRQLYEALRLALSLGGQGPQS